MRRRLIPCVEFLLPSLAVGERGTDEKEGIERMRKRELSGAIGSREVSTPRLRTHLLESGPQEGVPVVFVHGNVASSRFFEETLASLPPYYRGLAPDLRGFGRSEPKPVDATRGMRDLSDDLYELMKASGYAEEDRKVHLGGLSLGGGVVMQYAIDHPEEVASLTLSSPIPPYGMGGTKDICGTPCWPDYAGSGGGLANLDFVRFLEQGIGDDPREPDNPSSPRNVMNTTYFKPPFRLFMADQPFCMEPRHSYRGGPVWFFDCLDIAFATLFSPLTGLGKTSQCDQLTLSAHHAPS